MRYCCRQAPESLQTANLNLQQRDARRAALPNNNAVRIKRSGLHFLVKRTHTHTLCICLSVCMGVWEWVRDRERGRTPEENTYGVFSITQRDSLWQYTIATSEIWINKPRRQGKNVRCQSVKMGKSLEAVFSTCMSGRECFGSFELV